MSAATGLAQTTVRRFLEKAADAELSWSLPDDVDDYQLEERLFGRRSAAASVGGRPEPDWEEVHRELRRPGVTLHLVRSEYKQRFPSGYEYTWFTIQYRQWARQLDVTLRQRHVAGDKLFVDFAGQRLAIIDRRTGEVANAEIFVAVLGASDYTYAEAVPSQELRHWIAAHVNALRFFGGVPRVIVPDNLKAGVVRAHRYEPELNRTYAEFAAHYGCAVVPARPRKPRDKAKVESAVLTVERWVLARLRNATFFSLDEANEAIAELVDQLNHRHMKETMERGPHPYGVTFYMVIVSNQGLGLIGYAALTTYA